MAVHAFSDSDVVSKWSPENMALEKDLLNA